MFIDTLHELEARWVQVGARIVPRLQGGLADDVVRDRAARIGVEFPSELVTWWGWHNGVEVGDGEDWSSFSIGPGGFRLLSLDEALAEYDDWRRIHAAPDVMVWEGSWIPLVSFQAERLAVDCTAGPGETCPVRFIGETWEGHEQPVASSLEGLVEHWLDAFDAGAVTWDDELDDWALLEWDEIPVAFRSSRVL